MQRLCLCGGFGNLSRPWLPILVCVQTFAGAPAFADDGAEHWAFRKPVRHAVAAAASLKYGPRVVNPIDAFVLRKLEREGLTPAPPADRGTLLRRAYFDLLGLPPAPEDVEKFAQDKSSDAWPNLIDELLKSKHYGERWGRHWLDVARYADTGGYETDIYYRNAWRYRDYVVKSLNDDKPYDVFVQEQIAGDELWPDNLDLDPKRVYEVPKDKLRHQEARTGTGFFSLGPMIHESALDAHRARYESLTDWVDSMGSVFLGLTLGCARCHEHKFDPISQRDYYAMQAIFAGSVLVEESLLNEMEVNDWNQFYPRVLAVEQARIAYELFEKETAGRKLSAEESEQKRRLLENIGRLVLELPRRGGGDANKGFDELMGHPKIAVLGREHPELVKPVRFLERGELYGAREKIDAALPAALAKATGRSKNLPGPYGSRKELTLWLTQPDHPLTARVMVNRIWQWHFGSGIVATPNDFGDHGTAPTHPQLLDWLATEFVAQGWSVKQLHRLIMRSSTYQMSSRYHTESNFSKDPQNRLLWRMNRRRLEAEALWDAVHATAGTLSLKMGGRPVIPPLTDDEMTALRHPWHWPVSADPADHVRRGLYILVKRNFRFPMFAVFDAPVTSVSCPQRDVTTVAPQALWSLNSPSVYRQAEQLAARVRKEAGPEPVKCVERLWLIALGRHVGEKERQEALQLWERLADSPGEGERDEKAAFVKLCLAVYNLNEFAFVD